MTALQLILVIQYLIIFSSECEAEDKFLLLQNKVLEQNVKLEELHSRIAEQDVKIAQQDTKIAEEKNLNCEMKKKINDLEAVIYAEDAKETKLTEFGTVFTRWGRRDCTENTSTIVYSGVVGGSHYTHSGAAVDYLCLPLDPSWGINKHFDGPHWAYIYGSEYEDVSNINLKDYNSPCAVCRASKFSTVIMIPGRSQCYPGWQKAYQGELMAGYHGHAAASEYICVDSRAEPYGSKDNANGKLLYPVKVQCGSLPCPPYEANKLVSCVVCLK